MTLTHCLSLTLGFAAFLWTFFAAGPAAAQTATRVPPGNGSTAPELLTGIPEGKVRLRPALDPYVIRRRFVRVSADLLKRLPELFCGFPRPRSHGPTFYPVACAPQAWAAAAPVSLLASCLGISFDPDDGYVVFDQPVLPGFVDDIGLRQLALGAASIDVQLDRAGSQVAVHVLDRRGPVRAITRS